jgi:hypothetical protein
MSVMETFHLSVAAEAAKTPAKTCRRWMDNNVIKLRGNDSNPTGSGNYCGLSRNRVLQLAVTQALVKNEVSLSTAAKAALAFSDSGNVGREAGQLFARAKTALVLSPTGAVVSNLDFDSRVSDIYTDGVAIVLDLNKVVADVDAVLYSYN